MFKQAMGGTAIDNTVTGHQTENGVGPPEEEARTLTSAPYTQSTSGYGTGIEA